ncbi:CACTA en-spm transposon protein [Cucumis melo var. makuwa]|uniref:CACTA en-spm transposon protein n=1 Tax=Cucumis melo var. makuwa TaxID=1194695 RepID=A0A5A7U978_CUCMM|nr:CACTA en-spm transposon protein [Cucumis melo var. makuwa]
MRPSFDVCYYNGCIVGGLRFHTSELGSRRTTQNSGVMVIGESNASGSGGNNFYGIMSYTSNNFLDTDAMFLKFDDDLDNLARGSSSVGENTVGSSSQPPATPTPKRCAQSRLLKLERHIAGNGRIPMTITLGAKKPISPHAVFFNQAIGVCVRKRFPVHCLKWADVGREYIEVVKNDLQFFVLDFNDQAMNSDLEEARANPPAYWLDIIRIDTSSATTT